MEVLEAFRTTTKRQHCVLDHDGAQRPASKILLIFSSSTGSVLYLRILLLLLIASNKSKFLLLRFVSLPFTVFFFKKYFRQVFSGR